MEARKINFLSKVTQEENSIKARIQSDFSLILNVNYRTFKILDWYVWML